VPTESTPRRRPPAKDQPDRDQTAQANPEPSPPPKPGPTVDGVELPPLRTGPQLARAVLDAARANRPQRGQRYSDSGRPGAGRRLRGYSGSGPDPRDPQPLSAMLGKLMKSRGWQQPAAEGRLFGAWAAVVGDDLAAHSKPVMLEDGVLTIEAESTAWATQLRLMASKLLARIASEVGNNVVKRLNIHGPVAPSWAKGPKRVRGRGPRDTYG
jgi:predicted nucleic acid-binding Zn ribbon protein